MLADLPDFAVQIEPTLLCRRRRPAHPLVTVLAIFAFTMSVAAPLRPSTCPHARRAVFVTTFTLGCALALLPYLALSCDITTVGRRCRVAPPLKAGLTWVADTRRATTIVDDLIF